jgi:hypothetical protein
MLRLAWVKGSEADRQKMVAQWRPMAQPSQPVNHPTDTANDAATRCQLAAFLNKDARTMSEQELLRDAADCDTLVQELRRKGGKENLANAAISEQATHGTPAVQSSPQTDPRSVAGHQAEARVQALRKRDPNTVSGQELLRAATDCDTVVRELRREGGEANLANALTWDQDSRNMRAGKEAWVRLRALEQAKNEADAAAARYNAFIKRDANTVSEQELAGAANDAFFVSRYARLEGSGENLATAANWERAARNLSVGKEAYVKAANAAMTPAQFQALWNAEERRYAATMNGIANMSGSGYHYEVRSR